MSSIYYIEDIDSLRFALSIFDEFDLERLQPHFPGYPVFCFLGSTIYLITGSLANTFSIIGALSTFIIIYFSLLIANHKRNSLEYYLLILLIFFNPMILLMSNRYMPDLMGLSLFVASFYLLTQNKSKEIYIGGFLYGLLLGTRLSYFTLLILPYIMIFRRKNIKEITTLLFYTIFGCLIWLLPIIWMTGFEDLFYLAQGQTLGHFKDYGGTFLTEDNWSNRFFYFFQTIWSDGLGGYWQGRSNITMLLTLSFLPSLLFTLLWIKNNIRVNKRILILSLSIVTYTVFALYFQNIIYKSRHVMPIVYFLVVLIPFSLNAIKKNSIYKLTLPIYIFSLLILSMNLTLQHKQPTAISQLRNYLENYNEPVTIVTNPLINFYLTSTGIQTNFINIDNNQKIYNNNLLTKNSFMIGDYHKKISKTIIIEDDTSFYHNPYVNRMWSEINIYNLTKSQE